MRDQIAVLTLALAAVNIVAAVASAGFGQPMTYPAVTVSVLVALGVAYLASAYRS